MVSFTDPDNFRNLKPQYLMSLYGCGMMIWAWWAFDLFTFLGTFMSETVMAAQTISRQLVMVFYMIPVGLAQACIIMVGNNIGAKNIAMAKTYAKFCTVTALSWGLLSVALMLIFGESLIRIFSSNEEVVNTVLEVYACLWLYVFVDCVQCNGHGIIAGVGKQGKGSIYTLIGYWLIGIPVCFIQVFYFKMGIIALWLGPLTALVFNSFAYYILIWKIDWN